MTAWPINEGDKAHNTGLCAWRRGSCYLVVCEDVLEEGMLVIDGPAGQRRACWCPLYAQRSHASRQHQHNSSIHSRMHCGMTYVVKVTLQHPSETISTMVTGSLGCWKDFVATATNATHQRGYCQLMHAALKVGSQMQQRRAVW